MLWDKQNTALLYTFMNCNVLFLISKLSKVPKINKKVSQADMAEMPTSLN